MSTLVGQCTSVTFLFVDGAGARELEAPPGALRPLPRGPKEAPKQAPPPHPLRGLIVVFGGRPQ